MLKISISRANDTIAARTCIPMTLAMRTETTLLCQLRDIRTRVKVSHLHLNHKQSRM